MYSSEIEGIESRVNPSMLTIPHDIKEIPLSLENSMLVISLSIFGWLWSTYENKYLPINLEPPMIWSINKYLPFYIRSIYHFLNIVMITQMKMLLIQFFFKKSIEFCMMAEDEIWNHSSILQKWFNYQYKC